MTQDLHAPLLFDYAGLSKRLLAFLVDSILIFLLSVAINIPISILGTLASMTTGLPLSVPFVIGMLFMLGGCYYIFFWTFRNGQTLGHRLLAIQVRRLSGASMTARVALIRYIGYYVALAPAFLGFLWIALDQHEQGWHDKLAGTVVVATEHKPHPRVALVLIAIFLIGSLLLAFLIGIFGFMVYREIEQQQKESQRTIQQLPMYQ